MNKKTKRAIVVAAIIALLLFIAGLVSCSIHQNRNSPSITDPGNTGSGQIADVPQDEPNRWGIHTDDNEQDTEDSTGTGGASTGTTDKKPGSPAHKPGSPSHEAAKPSEPGKPADSAKPTVPVTPSKPEEPEKKPVPPVKPDRPGSGGSSGGSGGGSVSYSPSKVEIIAPEYSHTDLLFEVKTVLSFVKTLEWSITDSEGKAVAAELVKGSLDKTGGKLTITAPGEYTLHAKATNYGSRVYEFSKSILIHPDAAISIELSKTAHTDREFSVKTVLSDNVTQQLNWHILKDGKEVKWQDYVSGTLTNAGGSIRITEKGSYTLKATVYDMTSREFSGRAGVQVYPVVELSMQTPKTAHTDTPATVSLTTKELGDLDAVWSVFINNKISPLAGAVSGTLGNEGGSVRFTKKGGYTLIATVTDETGRAFSAKSECTVYPVASFRFTLPATTHTDQAVKVSVTSSELQNMNAVWTVFKDGKIVPPASVISGTLNNEGGSIRFTKKGSYALRATLTDDTGREYSHEASTVVYPVAETGFYLPAMTHTDTTVEVKTSFKDTQGLTAVWSLTRDGKPISLSAGFSGTLDNDGGRIRFKEVGSYELKAAVTDGAGRSFTYTSPCKVYPVLTVSLTLPKETHTDRPAPVSAKVEGSDIPIRWDITKQGDASNMEFPEGVYSTGNGTFTFSVKGFYRVTSYVTDEAGRTFSASKYIKVYPVPQMVFDVPEAAHTDDRLAVEVACRDMEELTAIWFVDNTFGFQDWDTYIDGELRNNGGTIRFKRAGVYDLQARATDATGRVFRFNSGKIEILPVLSLSFSLPEVGYTDTVIDVRTRGNNGVLPIEWTLIKNGDSIPLEEALTGSLNAQGGKIRFTSAGEYRLTATMFDALGRIFSHSQKISVHPLRNCDFTMPSQIHAGDPFAVAMSQSANLGGQSIVWTAAKDGTGVDLSAYVKGSLGNSGGAIFINVPGDYTLTATITDTLGRVFSSSQSIAVTNTAPTTPRLTADVTRVYSGSKFRVNLSVSSTDADGDAISYEYQGKASDDYYALGTYTVRVRAKDSFGGISDWAETTFSVVNSAPTKPTLTANVTRTYAGGKFLVNMIRGNSTDPDGDAVSYEYQGKAADDYYALGTYTVKVRAKDNFGGVSDWAETTFSVVNSAPTMPTLSASVTRTVQNGKFLVNFTLGPSTDPDGDAITYEYQNKTSDSYYALGTHTVQVRAKDNFGGVSGWRAVTFTVANSAPSRPVITRTPNTNSVVPGTPVTITASSTDPDGDPITYVWDGRGAQTATYPLGKNTVRVKAVDSTGAESPWAAIVFFVMDSSGSGGMMLTGPNSTINENGIEGATITNYTFTVPPVSGHNGNDYGRVRGYNIKTGQWDQLDYGTTNNGISFTRELTPGTYSKLEMYYYTNHDCMYNKSNITYTVNYYFE